MFAFAQEGHPLVGSWYGDWGPSPTSRNQVIVVMSLQGKNITGVIFNPGPESFPLKVAKLDSTKWTVHIEAEIKDSSGKTVQIVADGKLEDLGSPKRALSGTWTQAGVKGNFKITRE
jgi:hypothetical protein